MPTPPNFPLTFDAALEANCALSERQLPSDSSSLTRSRRRAPTNIYYASLHSGTFRWRFRCTQQPQSNPRSCLALAETFDPILLPAFSAATLCAMIGRPADNADIRLPSRSLPCPTWGPRTNRACSSTWSSTGSAPRPVSSARGPRENPASFRKVNDSSPGLSANWMDPIKTFDFTGFSQIPHKSIAISGKHLSRMSCGHGSLLPSAQSQVSSSHPDLDPQRYFRFVQIDARANHF